MADQAYERGLEIRTHVLGAVNHAVTREEIRELMIRAMPYCGSSAALDGLRNSAAVLDELGVA